MKWIKVEDELPKHMQIVRAWVDHRLFGSFERVRDCVFLRFEGDEEGAFYDSEQQIHLDYITKWKPKND